MAENVLHQLNSLAHAQIGPGSPTELAVSLSLSFFYKGREHAQPGLSILAADHSCSTAFIYLDI